MSMIFNPKYRDMPSQVQKNKNDIEMLKTRLKNVYYTTDFKDDDGDTMTIFVSHTNFPLLDFSDPEVVAEFVPSAYIITGNSYLMKVTSISYNPAVQTSVAIAELVCDIQGADGEPGADGQNATSISLGSVTEGDEASATLTPTGDGVYTLDLVLPRGEQGEPGEPGEDGEPGQNAVISGVTATIDSGVGTPDIDVEMSGTPQNRTFNFDFHNLKGEKGDDATSLSIGTVSTLQPNQPASASLTSDGEGNYELDLGIPKGANGTNGVDGKGFEIKGAYITSSQWEVNTGTAPYTPTYYPYRTFIPIDANFNGSSPVFVIFQASDIESYTLAPYCTFATVDDVGGVYIFTSDNTRSIPVKLLYYIAEVI